MDWDDVKPKAKGVALGENLETLSIAELTARVEALKAEIERVAAEIARKQAHEQAASKLFKS
jgi:uncharacterized small protein (DUF1192 family)